MSAKACAKILIVDDHEDNLDLLRMMLSSHGYSITTASDGSEALELVRLVAPDLILLDVMMPGMSGYDVVQALRADVSRGYIPIMLITAKQDISDKVQGLNIGADDFLPKPVQSAELIAKVRALLRLKQVQDELVQERNKNEMLYLIGQQLNSTLDVDQIISETLNLMVNMIGATHGSVIIKDVKAKTWRTIVAPVPTFVPPVPDASVQVIANGLAGLALRTGKPQLVEDTLGDRRWLPLHENLVRTRTAFAIPLIRDRIELGVLTLSHSEPYRFSPEQLPIVLTVATQVITALHNANLYTQLKEAEAAREYFVHMLTHDLRGPLAGVLGCLHVLSTSMKGESDQQFIDMARRACGAQEELISDILDVYRAESGLLELTHEELKPLKLRDRVLDQLAGAAAERNIALTIDVPTELKIVADVEKLTRVVINLVNNAIKFTRKGSVHVTAAYSADHTQAQFSVRDTGAGIVPEDVAHIFDRFFRSRQTSSRHGSGLGLDFCREVVQAHGGKIWAESQLNIGTTIHFTIPLEGKHHEQMAVTGR
ncbi:MAG: response regulator [Chloroflexota bacterium]|nr:response regulator [Chloroflexota bacterium]PLS83416.1 MAG: hypothetical protein CYG59_01325 [Chloroflexota bacterium]